MSWLGDFGDELERRRVRPAMRERLLAEFADHIACEQGEKTRIELTRLGAAREIAAQYADELAAEDARRGAFGAFAALACVAVAFVVQQLTLARIGYPGFNHGYSTPLALIAILALVVGSQVALVCGTLAAWRALRRRSQTVLPAAEIALVHRRSRLALVAGFATTAGLALYVINFAGVLPLWWLLTSGALAAAAATALLFAWREIARGSITVALTTGPAGDIYDDIPALRPLRSHPLGLWALTAIAVGGAVTAFEWHAEHSLAEGLQRGGFEVLALSAGFALLGRAIGARR
jgi:uncharacterized integral membrane protein